MPKFMLEVDFLLAKLPAIPQKASHDSFQNWQKHWVQCIRNGGNYFQGDKA
jgi:hypothetical protein